MKDGNLRKERRPIVRALGWAAAPAATAFGSMDVAEQRKGMGLGTRETPNLSQRQGSHAEINRDADLGTVQAVIGSVTTSAAFALGGVALMVLPNLVVGNELLILGVVALAVGGWALAHRHGEMKGRLKAKG